MEIILSGRHFEIEDELKQYVEERFQKLAETHFKLTTARIVMEMQRNWKVVEAHVNGKGVEFDANAQTDDIRVSVDEVIDKLEKQIRRHLGKVHNHRPEQRLSETLKDEGLPEDEEVVENETV